MLRFIKARLLLRVPRQPDGGIAGPPCPAIYGGSFAGWGVLLHADRCHAGCNRWRDGLLLEPAHPLNLYRPHTRTSPLYRNQRMAGLLLRRKPALVSRGPARPFWHSISEKCTPMSGTRFEVSTSRPFLRMLGRRSVLRGRDARHHRPTPTDFSLFTAIAPPS